MTDNGAFPGDTNDPTSDTSFQSFKDWFDSWFEDPGHAAETRDYAITALYLLGTIARELTRIADNTQD